MPECRSTTLFVTLRCRPHDNSAIQFESPHISASPTHMNTHPRELASEPSTPQTSTEHSPPSCRPEEKIRRSGPEDKQRRQTKFRRRTPKRKRHYPRVFRVGASTTNKIPPQKARKNLTLSTSSGL